MKSIILIAPPAAGKGTQSNLIKTKYKIPHISTGDLLRSIIASGSDIGKEISLLVNEGKLISDELIIEILKERLENSDCINGYILDGFPRNINQAIKYDEMLRKLNIPIGVVIYLSIDKNIAKQRILGRMTCPKCGSIYNCFTQSSPKTEGICNSCNIQLTKRSDDNENTFNKRYDTYINETQPLIDYYKRQGVLFEIDSSSDKEIVFSEIQNLLEKIND